MMKKSLAFKVVGLIFGIPLLFLLFSFVYLLIDDFFDDRRDRAREKAITQQMYSELQTLPELKLVQSFGQFGNVIAVFEGKNQERVRVELSSHRPIRFLSNTIDFPCYNTASPSKPTGWIQFGFTTNGESPLKKWFPDQVTNLRELSEHLPEIVKTYNSLPEQEGTDYIDYPDPNFILQYTIKDQPVTCYIYRSEPFYEE